MLGGGLVALAAGIEQILVIRIIRIIDDVVHLLLAGLDAGSLRGPARPFLAHHAAQHVAKSEHMRIHQSLGILLAHSPPLHRIGTL